MAAKSHDPRPPIERMLDTVFPAPPEFELEEVPARGLVTGNGKLFRLMLRLNKKPRVPALLFLHDGSSGQERAAVAWLSRIAKHHGASAAVLVPGGKGPHLRTHPAACPVFVVGERDGFFVSGIGKNHFEKCRMCDGWTHHDYWLTSAGGVHQGVLGGGCAMCGTLRFECACEENHDLRLGASRRCGCAMTYWNDAGELGCLDHKLERFGRVKACKLILAEPICGFLRRRKSHASWRDLT